MNDLVSGDFYLDETSEFAIEGTPAGLVFPRWMHVTHCEDKRMALILLAGESLTLPKFVRVERNTKLYLRYSAALPSISPDGLSCEILFKGFDVPQAAQLLCALPVPAGEQSPHWRVVDLDVSALAGREGCLMIRCQPGEKNDPTGDWLALSDLCVARDDELSMLRARSFYALRSRNEIEHFSNVYRHGMYAEPQNRRAENAAGQSRSIRRLTVNGAVPAIRGEAVVVELEALSGESACDYASRMLSASIPQAPPDFQERLKARADGGRVVKVLSLCSGAARIEASFASQVGALVEWSLLDINVDLLQLASRQFSPEIKLDLVEGNANDLVFSGEKWDVILCVSALHHVVELEQLVRFCHDSLNEHGEFWSIGECVGRNGNRLWPDSRAEANRFFAQLPDRYRLNRHTNQLDREIPDNDYSVGCFEGIRSEEIEPVLDRWFHPVDVYRRNCFLWRLINLAYSDNFDPGVADDRRWIVQMVAAELDHFRAGGRSTELFGVYRPRPLGRSNADTKGSPPVEFSAPNFH